MASLNNIDSSIREIEKDYGLGKTMLTLDLREKVATFAEKHGL